MICDSLSDSRAGFRSFILCGCMRVCVCVYVCVRVSVSLCVCVGGASFNALPALTRVFSPSAIVVVVAAVVAVLETRQASRSGLEVDGRLEVRGVAIDQCA